MPPGIAVDRDVTCHAADGAALRADVYRPADSGPRPALLLRLPYGKTAADSDVAFAHPAWLAAQGFLVVVQDTRGRWSSEGSFYPFRDEAADGHATVEWASALPGCDGRVVSYGFSYPGLIQLLAAARRPRGLVGICPAFTASQACDGWAYQGGALSGFTVEWATELALDGARRAGDYDSFRLLRAQLAGGDAWHLPPDTDAVVRKYSGWLDDWCAPSASWNVEVAYGDIDVPALHTGGWWDRFARGTIGNFRRLRGAAATPDARAGQRLVMGPWRHMPWSPLPEPGPSGRDVVDLHLAWWRQLLYGEPAPLLRDPVRAWVTGHGWRGYPEWPPPATIARWHLGSGGRAATRFGDGTLGARRDPRGTTPDVLPYDPWLALPRDGGHGCCLAEVTPMGPACQCTAEESPTVLVYTSDPLPAPALLAGDVTAEIWMAADALSADVCARLCVVSADGCSENLLEGITRTYRAGTEGTEPVRYAVDLGPVARRLEAGERLRLQLSGSDHPLWDLNLTTGERWSPRRASFGGTATQVFYHDAAHPSALLLPIEPEEAP
jgi:putative CocE/NonD family hydrolase